MEDDHGFEAGERLRGLAIGELLEVLRVLDEGGHSPAVFDNVSGLFGGQGWVDGDGDGAGHHDGDVGDDSLFARVGEDGDAITFANAELDEGGGEGSAFAIPLVPGCGGPFSCALGAQGRAIATYAELRVERLENGGCHSDLAKRRGCRHKAGRARAAPR